MPTIEERALALIERLREHVAELNCLHLRANRLVSAERTRAVLAETEAFMRGLKLVEVGDAD